MTSKARVVTVPKHVTKGIICIPSLSNYIPEKLKNLVLNDESNSFSLGESLESFSTLLELVFEYLERHDLENAKLVNTTWNAAATRELQKRIWPSWLEFCIDPECLRISPGFTFSNVALGIFAYNPQYVKLRKSVCLHYTPEYHNVLSLKYVVEELMPKNLEYLTIRCVITCSNECPKLQCTLINYYCKSAYQCLLLPNIPKIRISTMYTLFGKKIPELKNPDEIIRCVLIFSKRCGNRFLMKLRDKLVLHGETPDSVAVGGGLVDAAGFSHHTTEKKAGHSKEDMFCIIFSQQKDAQPDFDAYSLIFKEGDIFEVDLLTFKSQMVQRKYGVIFRFCCCAKGDGNHETSILAAQFPRYQLLGFEVNGEIGWNTSDEAYFLNSVLRPGKGGAPLKKLPKIEKPLTLHSYSTVVVAITWGPEIP